MKITAIATTILSTAAAQGTNADISASLINTMQCLAQNIDQCHWDNKNTAGYEDGGWSALYMRCKLYDLAEVRPLSGSAAITKWCGEQKKLAANWQCLNVNAEMCHWGRKEDSKGKVIPGWSPLYTKCKLYEIPEVNKLSGEQDISEWCHLTNQANKENVFQYTENQNPIQCLANNYGMCKWGNTDSQGLNTGGWSEAYMKCKLYDIPAVNKLSGEKQCTGWCDQQKNQVESYKCAQDNAHMCHWGQNDFDGKNTGGWSALYEKCKLYQIPEVNKLSGNKECTDWCNRTVGPEYWLKF